MSSSKGKQVEQGNRERAEEILARLGKAEALNGAEIGDPRFPFIYAELQARATLALADEVKRLNDQLADVIDPSALPSFPGVVRVRNEASDV